ncbi:RagB/SusD family nutrient uptake outer membrane protein [Chitinophaga sp. YR573]|uniref:RagB/SusD family nutrient uptake outer membrane protein n=1 Tax=Chitinophaga sp. YR573 TaxID=1881040 RepID=UPI000B7D2C78|nr:RagB/SusD family nutrient uptake outer membrane protein [Chitinophaga sp. YR573]
MRSIYFLILLLSAVSCKKYLNVTPENVGTLEYAFRNRNEAENYLFTCYSTLQFMSNVAMNAGFTGSAEIIYPNNLSEHPVFEGGFNMIRGTQNVISPSLNYWDGENGGVSLYVAIRRCNIFLDNIDLPVDLSATEKKRWIAEAKFMKAYYHFYLARMYGSIPVIRKNLPVNASTEAVRVKREPVDSVFNYIVQLLDEAIPDLPPSIENQVKELGRITSVAAMSVKAEVLATAASPLFNGNPDYAGFKDKDGTALFPASYDAQKWQKAADACKAAILASEEQGLHLYTFIVPANISKLSDSLKQLLTIQNAVTEKWDVNPELIWALNPTFGYQSCCIPRMTSKSVANVTSASSNFAVPESVAELFYTRNGVPINEDKTWDYAGRYGLRSGDPANKYYIREGYETIKAHFNREPRFYASIGFDGGIWFGNGVLDQENALSVQAKGNTSFAGPKDLIRINITGNWPKKLVHYQTVFDDGLQEVAYHLPLIRLAGLYLLYAETLNEVNGPTAEVFQYIDRVRQRAGLQGIQDAWSNYSRSPGKPSTKDGLRQIIHQERRIELCFEAQSGWDLRRWKELQGVLSSPLQGWSIYETSSANYYRLQTQLVPSYGIREYLWPVKDIDLTINPNLVQSLYW